jgi:GNAT superfamily N-acetyltransferase
MIVFKSLEISDIEIIVSMMEDFYSIDNYPIDIATSKTLFKTFLTDENLGKAWLIFSEDKIVGYAILTFVFSFEYKGKIAFLDELYLIESARGIGIGRKAIQFIKSEVHKLKLKIIYLEIERHNLSAQKLYIANDFETHNRNLMKYIVK